MDVRTFAIPDLKLVIPKRHGDARGFFVELWTDRRFRERVADVGFVQDNLSRSAEKGTIRGLHFQKPPHAQGKLVQCLRGAVLDVVVDIRIGSPTYRQHVSVRLDAAEGAQLWVPPGFLHGFCTLEPDCEVAYKVTDYYSPADDGAVIWSDPDLGIDWPVGPGGAVVSDKDGRAPRLADLPPIFHYEARA